MRRTVLLLASTALAVLLASGVAIFAPTKQATAAFQAEANGEITVNFFPPTGGNEVYTMAPDGSNLVNLSNHPSDDFGPNWSPDGRKVVFSSNRDGDYEIFVADADGSNPVNLTNNSTPDQLPDWSPDGTKIVYVGQPTSRNQIFVMEANGSNPVQLTEIFNGDDYWPVWSPDGTKIAFTRYEGLDSNIYVMDADGSDERNLTNEATTAEDPPLQEYQPDWSPDGSKILFSRSSPNLIVPPRNYTMAPDGSNQTPVTEAVSWGGVWSPDGTAIAYIVGKDVGNASVVATGIEVRNLEDGGVDPIYVDQPDDDLTLNGVLDWRPNTAPVVTPLRPLPGLRTKDRTPRIEAQVTDEHTELAKQDLTLSIDNKTLSRKAFAYDAANDRLTYTPRKDLSYGSHKVSIVAEDSAKVATTKTWSFRVIKRR